MAIDLGSSGSVGGWSLGQRPDVDVRGLLELHGRARWMRDALCREHPEVDFFPDRGQSLEPARAVCGGCMVRGECLVYALEREARLLGRHERARAADDPAAESGELGAVLARRGDQRPAPMLTVASIRDRHL